MFLLLVLSEIERNPTHNVIKIRHSNDANLLYNFFATFFRLQFQETNNYFIIL